MIGIIILIIALVINFFSWTYVFAINRKSQVSKAYLYYIGSFIAWITMDIYMRGWMTFPYNLNYLRIMSIFWLFLGIGLIHFIYPVLNREKDFLYNLFGVSYFFSLIVSFTTTMPRTPNDLFIVCTTINIVLPAIYSIYLLLSEYAHERRIKQKRNLQILSIGILVALIIGFIIDVLPQILGIMDNQYQWRLGPAVTAIQALVILPLIVRYNLVVYPIEHLALDIFNSANDGIVLFDRKGVILNINEKAEKELHINFSEDKEIRITGIFQNYEYNKEYTNFTTSLQSNLESSFLISQSNIKLEHPRKCMLLIFKNITEEKQLSQQLSETEEKFKYIFDRSPIGIFRLDVNGNVLEVNQSILNFLGIGSINDLNKKGIQHYFKDEKQYIKLLNELLEKNYISYEEVELVGQKNHAIIAKLNAQVIFDSEGKPQFIEGIIDNITDRILAERKLISSKEEYQNLVETANDIIFHVDVNGCYTYVNPQLTRITGYSPEDTIGKEAVIHVRKDYKEEVRQFYIDQFKNMVADTYLEIPIIKKDGSHMWVGNAAHMVIENDFVKGFNVISRDITELKRNELIRQTMYEISKIVNSTMNLEHLYAEIRESLNKLMDTTNFYIALYNQEEDIIRFTEIWDARDQSPVIENASKSGSITVKVILTGKPLLLKEKQLSKLHSSKNPPSGEKAKIWLGVPLNVKGNIIGAIAVQSYDDPNCYSNDDMRVLESVAEHIGIAIHRSQAEEKLRESEGKLTKSQEIAHLGNWEQEHPNGKYYWSDESKRIFGFDIEEEITSSKFWERLHPEDLDWMKKTWIRIEKEMNPYQGTFRIIRPDGTERVIFERAEFLSDEEGNLTKTIGTIMDITEQEEIKKTLEKTQQDYQALVESSTDMIYQIDINGIYQYVNPVLAEHSEFEINELIGKNSMDFVVPEQRDQVNSVFREQFINRVPNVKSEMLIVSRSGKKYWIEGNARLIKEGNFITGYYVICRDITERKKAEEKILESQNQLRKLSNYLQTLQEEERKRIAREIHDELGQNLTGIKMDIAYLKGRAQGDSVDLKIIERLDSLSRLTDLTINTTRRISQELRPSILDDLGLIPAIEWQIKEFGERTKIQIESCLPEESVEFDMGHATAIFRIIQESLTNVAKHSNAKNVKITLEKTQENVSLIVQDDGKGISENEIHKGTSFGLMGMQERANIWGGEISFEGIKNKGTKVIVNIPTLQE